MNMKKTVLGASMATALAALGATTLGTLGVVGTASAVHMNAQQKGEVLIYPYYTVNGNIETLLSIVNTTTAPKAVKVRFLEGKGSEEVLDFNLYLSPLDVWTGKIQPSDTGDSGSPAQLISVDKSCTVPRLYDTVVDPDSGEVTYPPIAVPFRNFEYEGDGAGDELARTREGYFEIIEMGVGYDENPIDNTNIWEDLWGILGNSVHIPQSDRSEPAIPFDCDALVSAWSLGGTSTWIGNSGYDISEPTGGLFGSVQLIAVSSGEEVGVRAAALDHFYDPVFFDEDLHTSPGNTQPALDAVFPSVSFLLDDNRFIASDWLTFTTDAVSALMMVEGVLNEYDLNPVLESETSWVVTFPTKWDYVDTGRNPFTSVFGRNGACETIIAGIVDREEQSPLIDPPGGPDFSPLPPIPPILEEQICWEVNVLNFNDSDVLNSNLAKTITVPENFTAGWMDLVFASDIDGDLLGDNWMVSLDGDVYLGLPTLGFRTTVIFNDNVGIGAAYADAIPNSGTARIFEPGDPDIPPNIPGGGGPNGGGNGGIDPVL